MATAPWTPQPLLSGPLRPAWQPYLVATLTTIALVAVLLLPLPYLSQAPLLVLFSAVAVGAWQGGFRAGLLALGLATFAGAYLFLPATATPVATVPDDQARLACFALSGLLTTVCFAGLRVTNRRAGAAQRRLHDLIDDLDAIVWEGDPISQRFTFVSQHAEVILGYPPSRWLNEANFWTAPIHAEDQARVVAVRRTVLATGRPASVEYRAVTQDNQQRWLRDSIAVAHSGGRRRRIRGVTIDITARRQAEATARQNAERLRFLAKASTLLAASLDYEATLTRVTELVVPALADACVVDICEEDGSLRPVAVTHRDPAMTALVRELRQRYPFRPDAPHGVPKVVRTGQAAIAPTVEDAWRVAAARDATHLELMRRLAICSSMIVPLIAHGRTLGAITFMVSSPARAYGPDDLSIAEDLARRAALAVANARLFTEVQAAVHARDLFLSTAAHELRTPMTTIKGTIQLLQRRQERSGLELDSVMEQLDVINRGVDRLALLVNQLLDVSRWRLGQVPHQAVPVDLATVVGQVVTHYQQQTVASHRLAVVAPSDGLPASVDLQRFEQLLVNLLDNAIKYSSGNGLIQVTVGQAPDGGVQLSVHDEGIGIPADQLEAIFEPFARAPNAARRQLPGMGLGLYLARLIARQHGGRLWAESAGEDQGATFHLWLPAPSHTA